ncbi:MAG: ABC transporter substrate-binding protein [Xenophilus sp.]
MTFPLDPLPCPSSFARRRRLLQALALAPAAALPGRAALAQPLQRLRVQLGWVANVQYAGEWIAQERGLFKANGLETEILPGGPNALPAPVVLAAGKVAIGYSSWFPILDAVAKGNPIVIVGAVFPKNPMGVLSLSRKPIRKAADLVGARLLVQGPNERTAIEATLKLAGLPANWTAVPAGFSPEPLLAGDGDGYTAFSTNQPIVLEKMGMRWGKDFFFTTFDEMGFRSLGAVLVTMRDYLDRHRDAVVAYVRSISQGWEQNEKDPAYAAKLAVQKYGADLGMDLQQQIRQNELQIPLARNDKPGMPRLALDHDTIAGPLYAAARATGRTSLPDIDNLVDFSVVAEASRPAKR